MKRTLLTLAFAVLALQACRDIPGAAYYQRGTPESLLQANSERIAIDLNNNPSAQDQLLQWLNQSQPTRAELHCVDGDLVCGNALRTLQDFGVPVDRVAGGSAVFLMYDQIAAKDCNNRYIDNPHNPYNLNHPTYGCSIAANMVQQVTDKNQFINPSLSDPMDGRRTYQILRGAAQPNNISPNSISTDFEPMIGGDSGS